MSDWALALVPLLGGTLAAGAPFIDALRLQARILVRLRYNWSTHPTPRECLWVEAFDGYVRPDTRWWIDLLQPHRFAAVKEADPQMSYEDQDGKWFRFVRDHLTKDEDEDFLRLIGFIPPDEIKPPPRRIKWSVRGDNVVWELRSYPLRRFLRRARERSKSEAANGSSAGSIFHGPGGLQLILFHGDLDSEEQLKLFGRPI